MNSNSGSAGGQREQTVYSFSNLPPSLKEATRRLDEVDEIIAKIDADLRTKTQQDCGSQDSYMSWRISASRALSHKRREKSFLLQWISNENGRLERNQEILSERERGERLQDMITEFLKSALPYGTPLDEDQLTDLERVTGRRAELAEVKMEYGAFLGFLKTQSIRMGCTNRSLFSVRTRVVRIVQDAETEIIRLNKIIRELEPRSNFAGKEIYDPSARPNGSGRLESIVASLHEVKLRSG